MESDVPLDALPADTDEDSETSYALAILSKLWVFVHKPGVWSFTMRMMHIA